MNNRFCDKPTTGIQLQHASQYKKNLSYSRQAPFQFRNEFSLQVWPQSISTWRPASTAAVAAVCITVSKEKCGSYKYMGMHHGVISHFIRTKEYTLALMEMLDW